MGAISIHLCVWVAALAAGGGFPPFQARDAITGAAFDLRDLRGSVVVVDFWATWCGPCRRNVPELKRLYDTYRDEGLEIVGISLDSNEARFRSYVRANDLDWHHVMEGGGWRTRLALQYEITSIPAVYVLGRDGARIAARPRGPQLESAIRRGLAAPAAAEPPAPGLESQLAARLWQRLDVASTELRRAADPLPELSARLGELVAQQDRLEPHLDELQRIRLTLFMMGVLDRWATPEQMQAACDDAGRELGRHQRRLVGLKGDLAAGASATSDLQQRIQDAHDRALRLAERWCEPWIDQVEAVQATLADMEADAEARDRPRLRRLSADAAAIHREVGERLAAGRDLDDLRGRFGELVRETLAGPDD